MAARRKPEITLDTAAIAAVVRDAAAKLEAVIRQELQRRIDETVRTAVGNIAKSPVRPSAAALRSIAAARSAPPAALRPAAGAPPALGLGGKPRRMCPVPNCPNYAAGPKYAWRCREHKQVSKAEIERLRGEDPVARPKVRRIAAQQAPRGGTRSGPPMDCRMPGCKVKSRGPRFDFFCGDHYASLNAEQRAHYKAKWKELREQAKAPEQAEPKPVVFVRKAATGETVPAPAATAPLAAPADTPVEAPAETPAAAPPAAE